MRLLRRVGLAIAALVGLVVVAGFLLPSTWHVERSLLIDAERVTVFGVIDTPRFWIDWAPWIPDSRTGFQHEYSEEARGAGAWWSWRWGESGSGRMEILRHVPYGLDFLLEFEGALPIQGAFRLEEVERSTRVTWSMAGDAGLNPIHRFIGRVIASRLEEDIASGLVGLRSRAEVAQVAFEEHVARHNEMVRAMEATEAVEAKPGATE